MLRRILTTFLITAGLLAAQGEDLPQWADGLSGPMLITVIKNNISSVNPIDDLQLGSTLLELDGKNGSVYCTIDRQNYTLSDFEQGVADGIRIVPMSWLTGGVASADLANDLHNIFVSPVTFIEKRRDVGPGVPVTNILFDNGVVKIGENSESTGVWSFPEEASGEFARAMMYMIVRTIGTFYVGGSMSFVNPWPQDGLYLHRDVAALLLDYHNAHPATAAEIARNNQIKRLQGNSNPFVEYPMLANAVWDSNYTVPDLGNNGDDGGDTSGKDDGNGNNNDNDNEGSDKENDGNNDNPGVEDEVPTGNLKGIYTVDDQWIFLSSPYVPLNASWSINGVKVEDRIAISSLEKGRHELKFEAGKVKGKVMIEIR